MDEIITTQLMAMAYRAQKLKDEELQKALDIVLAEIEERRPKQNPVPQPGETRRLDA